MGLFIYNSNNSIISNNNNHSSSSSKMMKLRILLTIFTLLFLTSSSSTYMTTTTTPPPLVSAQPIQTVTFLNCITNDNNRIVYDGLDPGNKYTHAEGISVGGTIATEPEQLQGCYITIRNVNTRFIEFVDEFNGGHIILENNTFLEVVAPMGCQMRFRQKLVNLDFVIIRDNFATVRTNQVAIIQFDPFGSVNGIGHMQFYNNRFVVNTTAVNFYFVWHQASVENVHRNISYHDNTITNYQRNAGAVSTRLIHFYGVKSTSLVNIANNVYTVSIASTISNAQLVYIYFHEEVDSTNITSLQITNNQLQGDGTGQNRMFFSMIHAGSAVSVAKDFTVRNNNVRDLSLSAENVIADMLLSFEDDITGQNYGQVTNTSVEVRRSFTVRDNFMNVTVEDAYNRSSISCMRLSGVRTLHDIDFLWNTLHVATIAVPVRNASVNIFKDRAVTTTLDFAVLHGVIDLVPDASSTFRVSNNYVDSSLECYMCTAAGHFFTVHGENITNTSSILLANNFVNSNTTAQQRLVSTDISTFLFNASVSEVGTFALSGNQARWFVDTANSSTTTNAADVNNSDYLTAMTSHLSSAHLFFAGAVVSIHQQISMQNEYFYIQSSANRNLVDPTARFLSFGSTVEGVRQIRFSNASFYGIFKDVNGTADLSVLTFVDSIERIARNRFLDMIVSGVTFNVIVESCYDFSPKLVGFGFFGSNTSEFRQLRIDNSIVNYHERLGVTCAGGTASSTTPDAVHRSHSAGDVEMIFFSATDRIGARAPLELINNTIRLEMIEEQRGHNSFMSNFTFAAFADLLKYAASDETAITFTGNSLLLDENDHFRANDNNSTTLTIKFPNGPVSLNLLLVNKYTTSVSAKDGSDIHFSVEDNMFQTQLFIHTSDYISSHFFHLSTTADSENTIMSLSSNVFALSGFYAGSSTGASTLSFFNFSSPSFESSAIHFIQNEFHIMDNNSVTNMNTGNVDKLTTVSWSERTSISFFSVHTRIDSPTSPLMVTENKMNIADLMLRGVDGSHPNPSILNPTPNRTCAVQFLRFNDHIDVGTFEQGLQITDNEFHAVVYESLDSYTTDSVVNISFFDLDGVEISSVYGATISITGNNGTAQVAASVIPLLDFFRFGSVVDNIFMINASDNAWAVTANRKARNGENATASSAGGSMFGGSSLFSTSVSSIMFKVANLVDVTYLFFDHNTIHLGDNCGGDLEFYLLLTGNGNKSYNLVWQWSISDNKVERSSSSAAAAALPGCNNNLLPTRELSITLSRFQHYAFENCTFLDLNRNSYDIQGLDFITSGSVFQFDEMIHNVSNFSIAENTGIIGTTARSANFQLVQFYKALSHIGFEQYNLRASPAVDRCFTTSSTTSTTTTTTSTTTTTTSTSTTTTSLNTTTSTTGNGTDIFTTLDPNTTIPETTEAPTSPPPPSTTTNGTTIEPCTNIPLEPLDKTYGFSFTIANNMFRATSTIDYSAFYANPHSTDGYCQFALANFNSSLKDVSTFAVEDNTANYHVVLAGGMPAKGSVTASLLFASNYVSELHSLNIRRSHIAFHTEATANTNSSHRLDAQVRESSIKIVDFHAGLFNIGNTSLEENTLTSSSSYFVNSSCTGFDLGLPQDDWKVEQKIEVLHNTITCEARESIDMKSTADFLKLRARNTGVISSTSTQLPGHILVADNSFVCSSHLDTFVSTSDNTAGDRTSFVSRFLAVEQDLTDENANERPSFNMKLFLVENNHVNFTLLPQLTIGNITAQFVSWQVNAEQPKVPTTTTTTTTSTTSTTTLPTETNSTSTTSTTASTTTLTSSTTEPSTDPPTSTYIVNCSDTNSSDPNATLGNVTCFATPTPPPPTTSSTTTSSTTSSTTTSSTTSSTSTSTSTSTTSTTTTSTTTTTTTTAAPLTTMPPSAAIRPSPSGLTVRNCEVSFTLAQSTDVNTASVVFDTNVTRNHFPMHSRNVNFHVASLGSSLNFSSTSLQFYDLTANFTFSATKFASLNDRAVTIGQTTAVHSAFVYFGSSSTFEANDDHFVLQDNIFGVVSHDENIYQLQSHFLELGSSLKNLTEVALDNLTYDLHVSGVDLGSPGIGSTVEWYHQPSNLVLLDISLGIFKSALEEISEFQVTSNKMVIMAARAVEKMSLLGVAILSSITEVSSVIVSMNDIMIKHEQGIIGSYVNSYTSRGLIGDFSFWNVSSSIWAPAATDPVATTSTAAPVVTTSVAPPPTTTNASNNSTGNETTTEAPTTTSTTAVPPPPPPSAEAQRASNRYAVENNKITYILVTFQQFERIMWQSNWYELGAVAVRNMGSISVQYNRLFTDLICVDRPGLPASDLPGIQNETSTMITSLMSTSSTTVMSSNGTTTEEVTSTTEVPSTTTATSTTTSTSSEPPSTGTTESTMSTTLSPADSINQSLRCIITGKDEGNRTFFSIGRLVSCDNVLFQSNTWEYTQNQISNYSHDPSNPHIRSEENGLHFINFHSTETSYANSLAISASAFDVVAASYGGSIFSLSEGTNLTLRGSVSITGTRGFLSQPVNKTGLWQVLPPRVVDYSLFHFFDGSALGFVELGLSSNEWNCTTIGDHPPANVTCGMFLLRSPSSDLAPSVGRSPVLIDGLIRAEDNIVVGDTKYTFPSYFRANNGSFGPDFSIRLRNNDLRNFASDDVFSTNTTRLLPNVIPRFLDVDDSVWYWSCNHWGDMAQNAARGRVCGSAKTCNNFPCSVTISRDTFTYSSTRSREPTKTNGSTLTRHATFTNTSSESETLYTPELPEESGSFTEEETPSLTQELTQTTYTLELTDTRTNVTPATMTLTSASRTHSEATFSGSVSADITASDNVSISTSLSQSHNITETRNTESMSYSPSKEASVTPSHEITATNWTFSKSKSESRSSSGTYLYIPIHAPDVLQPTITAMATGTALVAGISSLFGLGAAIPFIASAARTQAVINLLSGVIQESCGDKPNHLERAYAESPLDLDIGGKPSGILVGTLVGNISLTFGLLLLAFCVGGAFRSSRSVKGSRSACPSLLEAASACWLNYILVFCTLLLLIVTIGVGGTLSTRSEMPDLWRGFGPFIDVIIVALVCVWLYYSLFKKRLVMQFSWFEDTGLAPGFAKINSDKNNNKKKNVKSNGDFDDDGDAGSNGSSQDSDEKKKIGAVSTQSRRILEDSDDDDDLPPPHPPAELGDNEPSSPGQEMKTVNDFTPREENNNNNNNNNLEAPLIAAGSNNSGDDDDSDEDDEEEEEDEDQTPEELDEQDKTYKKLQADKKKRLQNAKQVSYYDRASFFIAYWFDPFGEWFIPTHHKNSREEQLRYKALVPLTQAYTDRSPRFLTLEIVIQILLGIAVIIADGADRSCGAHSTLFALIFSAYLVLVVAKKPFRHRVSHVTAVVASIFHLFAIIVCLLMSASSPSEWLRDLAYVLAALQIVIFTLAVFLFFKEVIWPYVPGLVAYIRGRKEQFDKDQKRKKEEEERKRKERNRKTEMDNAKGKGKGKGNSDDLEELHAEEDEDARKQRARGDTTLQTFSGQLEGRDRANTPVLGASPTTLYAGAHTPASSFPQPVLGQRDDHQQKEFDDMFSRLDKNLRQAAADLKDTEVKAQQSPRNTNRKRGKSLKAERIAKLNETEEELQREQKEKEEIGAQNNSNNNNDDDEDDSWDDADEEIGKQHDHAEKSYKSLTKQFDDFVGL